MKLRVKIYPSNEFLENLLKSKGVPIVEDNPQILHFGGHDKKDLKRLVKKYKPDLLITHSFPSFDLIDCMQIYHPLNEALDLIKRPKIYTNALPLCKNYYRRLGIQAEIITFPSNKKKAGYHDFYLKAMGKAQSIQKSFKDLMLWS